MSYKNFRNDIKNDSLRNLVLLYGSENLLIRWCMNEIIDKYVGEEYKETNFRDVDGDSTSVGDLIGMAVIGSFVPAKRVIVVRNFPMLFKKSAENALDLDRLLEFGNHTDYDSIVVLVLDSEHYGSLTASAKKLIKGCSSYDCERLTLPELRGFITKRMKTAGKYLGVKQLDHLIDLTGYLNRESEYTLDELENDIAKLVNATDDAEITNALIEELMVKEQDLFVFNFVDALVNNDHKTAMSMVLNILNKDESNAMQLIALLTSQFEMMYDARQLERTGDSIREMAKKLGVNEYRFKKAFKASNRFSDDKLEELVHKLYEIDGLIKSGDMDKDLALETFVLGA